MSNELSFHSGSNATYYAVMLNGNQALTTSGSLEAITLGNWSTYAIPLTGNSTVHRYFGSIPSTSPAGNYIVQYYTQAGGSPLSSDKFESEERIAWDGTQLSGATVWGWASRTVSQSGAQVSAAVSGSLITLLRGDYISIALTGLGDISSRTKLWFTVKSILSQPDTSALIQIAESTGMSRLNGAPVASSSYGSITVTDAVTGAVTIIIKSTASAYLDPATGLFYDVQMLTANGPITLISGNASVVADVTRTTT